MLRSNKFYAGIDIMQKVKYITNKELLLEIKKSKESFCYFVAPEYANYDMIVPSVEAITPELVEEAVRKRAENQSSKTQTVDPAGIDRGSIVFRVMTDSHLPVGDKNRKRENAEGDLVKANFPPFRHYIVRDGELVEVGRSHWKGDMETGQFRVDHGRINNRLASMFMLLVEQYARKGSFRGYTYNDEMRCHALVQLSQVGLQFDETRSSNSFAFYTQIVKNAFRRVLNLEKRAQTTRDDLLIMSGAMPSYTRQVDNAMAQNENYNEYSGPPNVSKRGRKPKRVE